MKPGRAPSRVVDGNEDKSLMPLVQYKIKDRLSVQAMYLGGVERKAGSPEGPNWRHHFDLFGQIDGRSSSPIFWGGAEWVTSGTVTVDLRPHEQLSVRLEYRHDVAEAPRYFAPGLRGDGSAAAPYLPNARTQDTVLLGATAWF